MRDFPLRAWAYTAAVAAAALAGTLALLSGTTFEVLPTVGFGALFLAAELAPVPLTHMSYSVSFVFALAAIIVLGPAGAAVAASFGALDLSVRRREDWLGRIVFNGAQLALTTLCAGWLYGVAGGPAGGVSIGDFPGIFLAAAAATVAYFVVNGALVTGMVVLVRRVSAREIWTANLPLVTVTYFCFAALGVLLASLYVPLGFGVMIFLLLPLLVARRAMHTSKTMREAFDATVRSVIAAIEAKDPYTRGHMERVARLSDWTARELRLPSHRARGVYYAAMMHDVGKLVVHTRVLQKPGRLTDAEFEHIKSHPLRGEEIVAEIEALAGVLDGVRHHHERVDGRGYPDGLSGDGLSAAARIIMAADAFDAMTSTRSYRPAKGVAASVAELERCAGSQFDPATVAALKRALGKHGWEPHADEVVPAPAPTRAVRVPASVVLATAE
ncbi:MAG: HD-GYP domain-containing protein [Acidobacteria bacterium]|nr:HD-GYP domain-containing protein [Acidobacteriota bacterium]